MTDTHDVYDWGMEIPAEDIGEGGGSFTVLPPGEYEFEVLSIEEDYYEASETSKISSCPMAVVRLTVRDADGEEARVRDRLYLHKGYSIQRIGDFFCSIGLYTRGESLKPDWKGAIGKTGRCVLRIDEYKGNERNQVSYYKDMDFGDCPF